MTFAAWLAVVSGISAFVGTVTAAAIGTYVVRRYPSFSDPRRTARRFVYPALTASSIAFAGVGGLIVSVFVALVVALTGN